MGSSVCLQIESQLAFLRTPDEQVNLSEDKVVDGSAVRLILRR